MTSELKAGFFVLAALTALVVMTTRLTQNQFSMRGTKVYYAKIQDATGLLSKTKLKMAGLDVGQLISLELIGKQALAKIEIASDLVLHKDAAVAVKAIGFLGDKYLELYPGSDTAPALEEGGYLAETAASGSLDQLTQKTTGLVENLKEITDLLKTSIKGTGDVDSDGTRLDRILDNMEQFSEGLAGLDKLGDLADRFAEVAANIRDITGKVNRGEGTIGKLISESETIDKLNQTLSGVNKLVTRADKMQVWVDTRSAALTSVGGSRTQFSLMLQPTFDKFYLVGVHSRPQPNVTVTTTATTPNADQPGASTTVEQKKVSTDNSVTFNLQFGKRFGDLVARLGLFENTGGLGLDYLFFNDNLKFSSEIYRFSKGQNPQLNASAEFNVYRPFFVWTGGDYLLSRLNRSYFVGAGIRFSDQDIKSLLATALSSGAAR